MTLKLRKEDGHYYSIFGLIVGLPEALKGIDGKGVTSAVDVKVDDDSTVLFGGVSFGAEKVKLGPLEVEKACFTFVTAGSGVEPCKAPSIAGYGPDDPRPGEAFLTCKPDPAAGNHWSASIAIKLPTPMMTRIGLFASGVDELPTAAAGFGDNLNIPIADGVVLNKLGAGVCLPTGGKTQLVIKGTAGVGVIPTGTGSLVKLDGTVTYSGDTATPSKWDLGFDVDVSIDKLGKLGHGGFDVASNGTFSFNVMAGVQLGLTHISGGVNGWYEPPTKKFNMEGGVKACILGDAGCISADGVISTVGIAGCVTLSSSASAADPFKAGLGYYWGDKDVTWMAGTCDLKPWRATKTAARAAAAAGTGSFVIPDGAHAIAFRAPGTTGPPALDISGPGGFHLVIPAGAGIVQKSNYLAVESAADKTTYVAINGLTPGTYTVKATDPANPLTRIDTAEVYASFSGKGNVADAAGGRKKLTLNYVQPTGAQVALVETGVAGGKTVVQRTIVPNLRGRKCGAQPRGGSALCTKVTFTPTPGAGGTRKIVAVVSRGGQPVTNEPVASYRIAAPKLPAKPRRVQVQRKGTTVTIRWTPSAGRGDLRRRRARHARRDEVLRRRGRLPRGQADRRGEGRRHHGRGGRDPLRHGRGQAGVGDAEVEEGERRRVRQDAGRQGLPLDRREQERAHLLGAPGGAEVALGAGDDRALHQDVPLAREVVGIGDCRRRSRGPSGTRGCARAGRCSRRRSASSGDGCSSITLMNEQPSKPGSWNQPSKTSKIASRRSRGSSRARLDVGLEPLARPALLAQREEREHQLLLGAEVAVQRLPRHAGGLDDRVDADRLDAARREQLVGGLEDPLAGGGCRWDGRRHPTEPTRRVGKE